MFSKFVQKLMRRAIDDGSKWGCLPYKWDARKSNLVVVTYSSATRKYFWYFNIAFYTAYMMHLSGRYFQRKFYGSSLKKKLIAEYVLLIYILTLIMRWCILLRYKELADFINSFLEFFRELDSPQRPQQRWKSFRSKKVDVIKNPAVNDGTLDGNNGQAMSSNDARSAELEVQKDFCCGLGSSHGQQQLRENSPSQKKVNVTTESAAHRTIAENGTNIHKGSINYAHAADLATKEEPELNPTQEKDRFLKFNMIMGFVTRWLDLLSPFTHPEADHLFTSFLSDPASSALWQRALLAIPHIYIWWTNWAILNFTVIFGLAYVRATVLTIIYARNLSYNSVGKDWIRLGKLYRALQLLQGKQGDAVGLIISTGKVILTFQTIRSLVLVFTHVGEDKALLLMAAVMGFASWTFLHCSFQLLGSIYEECTECLFKWKVNHRSPRWFRRTFVRSCWCLKMYVGGMYYADRNMNLTLNAEIFNKVVEAVLASI